ncbi:MAG TPA: hypothetical protein VI431_02265 [Candidatus Acidoferrum sp.]
MPFGVHRIAGLTYGQGRRDVAFLESDEDSRINVKEVFYALKEKHQTEMRNKFDYWKRGGHNDLWFHGFNEIAYRECFVFKRKQAGTYHRFYGFLIHPRPITEARYEVCILVSHGQKNQASTDPSELNFANAVRVNPKVVQAIKVQFPEKPGAPNASLHFRKR